MSRYLQLARTNLPRHRLRVRNQWSIVHQQQRRVSRQVWDCFGFIKDGTDLKKRDSVSYWCQNNLWKSRAIWIGITLGPGSTMLYLHGVWDYIFRRRKIVPLEIDYSQEFPWRPPEDYENPLFEPGRRYSAIRQKKREEWESKPYHRPWPYHRLNHD